MSITTIVVPRASDILASQLRQMIVQRLLPPGTFLPNERALVSDSGLSRSSVRDALRSLEAEGLISTKVGRSGGSMVTLPARESVARSVELFVRTHGIRMDSLLECRVAIEPTMARLAARHRTAHELEEIGHIHAQFVEAATDNVARYKECNLDWHLAVARASANEPLIALMEAISRPTRDAMDQRHVTTAELRAGAVRAHTVIYEAIRGRDEDAAFKGMDRHVRAYRDIAIKRASTGRDGT